MDGVAERHRRTALVALALALAVRAIMGLADAVAIFRGGVRAIPMPDAVALSAPSPLIPLTLAVLALAGATGISRRAALGWLLAAAACVAYLVSGIADLGSLRPGAPLADPGFWIFFAVDLVVPAAALSALLATRTWFERLARPRVRVAYRGTRR